MSSPRLNTTPTGPSQEIDISTISRFFVCVSVANYFLLLVCGNIVLSILVRVWSIHSVAEFTVMAIIGAVCGFATWVGWRNIGVLSAVVHSYTNAALVLLFTLSCVLSVILVPQLFSSREASYDELAGLIVWPIVALASLSGSFGLFVLNRLSLPGLQVNLRLFLMSDDPASYESRKRLKPSSPVKGYGLLAVGVLWLIALNLIPDDKLPKEFVQQEYRFRQVGFFFLIYARHYLRPDFQTVVSSDQRPPVLFLRSFEDDEKLDYQHADKALFDFSLESRLADQYSSLGPFIAIGKPGDKTPHFGAARANLSDAEWQDTVKNWMKYSTLIILMIGRTHWVEWELRRIIEAGYTWKLMILFPQVRPPRWKLFWRAGRVRDAEDRLTVIRKAFDGTPWQSGLRVTEGIKPPNLRSLAFLPGGEVTVVTSAPRNRESYHLAALIARHAKWRWKSSWDAAVVTTPAMPSARTMPGWRTALLAAAAIVVALGTWAFATTEGASLFNGPTLKSLPGSIVVRSTGTMRAGNFQFVDPSNADAESGTYHPGDRMSSTYNVAGMRTAQSDEANVQSTMTLLDSDDRPASKPTNSTFHQQIRASEQIRFTFSLNFSQTANPGDYHVDIQLHDDVSGDDFEFRPLLHLQEGIR